MIHLVFYVGLGLFVIGGIGLIIAAFRTHILWGLGILLIAPLALIYLLICWEKARGPFLLQVAGLVIILGMAATLGESALPAVKMPNLSSIGLSMPGNSSTTPNRSTQQFRCDGRQHCSQMRSRAEAEFFLRNCPGTKMDGDHDGIPCERDSRF